MADRIELKGVAVRGNHGVFDFEKREGQLFITDVTVWTDFRRAAATDDLSHTISYADMADTIHDVVAGPPRDLIETVASEIAEKIILDGHVQAVEVTIHKPDAPIEHEFADVAVVARRSRKDLYHAVLSLGSNMGDKEKALRSAISWFEDSPDYRVVGESSLYRTPAWGGVEQDDFLNAIIVVETNKEPIEILHDGQELERRAHRERTVHWGPRTLDVDVITVTNQGLTVTSGTEELTLPHPYAQERAFVLVPWAEVEPYGQLGRKSVPKLIEALPAADVNQVERV